MSPRGRPRKEAGPKRKAVKIRLCERTHAGKVTEAHQIMEEIIARDRQDLADIKIGIAWHTGWRPDADNVCTHGKCLKRTDLDRALDDYDFLIVLNETSWQAFDEHQKRRLITHELEHAQVARDGNGEIKIDDKGRVATRLRRHDFADFRSIVEKFGLPPCLSDVQIADADRPLLKLAEEKGKATAKDAHHAKKGAPAESRAAREHIRLKFKGLRGSEAWINLICEVGQWYAGYGIKLGNQGDEEDPMDAQARSSRVEALQAAKAKIGTWLQELTITGTADAKRATARRRDMMHEQIDAQLDPILNAAEEFTEDREPGDDGPEEHDGDEDLE